MHRELIASERLQCEGAITENYLEAPSESSFAELFRTFTPQLVAFFRARHCELSLAEDLAQDVMLTVHRKATQVLFLWIYRPPVGLRLFPALVNC